MTILEFVTNLFEVKTQIHHLHHITTSYSEHKALGKFYEKWDDLSDKLIETYQGCYERVEGQMLFSVGSQIDPAQYIIQTRMMLQLQDVIPQSEIDLINIIAEMIELCHHTSYLLTLK